MIDQLLSLTLRDVAPFFAALVIVAVLLSMFILPDYIYWRRQVRNLPKVEAHCIEFVSETGAKQVSISFQIDLTN